MSRSTQYIGLTKRAKDFLETHSAIEIDENNFTEGMFNEEVPLGVWKITLKCTSNSSDREDEIEIYKIREIVQNVPWSGGPMIFTCLELEYGHENNKVQCFEWVTDPTLREREWGGEEYDREEGTYWV